MSGQFNILSVNKNVTDVMLRQYFNKRISRDNKLWLYYALCNRDRYINKQSATTLTSLQCLSKLKVKRELHPRGYAYRDVQLYSFLDIVQQNIKNEPKHAFSKLQKRRARLQKKRDNKLLKQHIRKQILTIELKKAGLDLREDSFLCNQYITKNIGNLSDIVLRMCQMKQLFEIWKIKDSDAFDQARLLLRYNFHVVNYKQVLLETAEDIFMDDHDFVYPEYGSFAWQC